MVDNLKDITNHNHTEISRYINSSLLQLFWKIGGTLQNEGDKHSNIQNGQNVIKRVSNILKPLFGKYMDEDQLRLMKKFYKNYDNERNNNFFDFPNWLELTLLLNSISENDNSEAPSPSLETKTNLFRNHLAYPYFCGKDRNKFRNLVEPQELSTYELPIKRFEWNLVNDIYNEIIKAQIRINLSVNIDFNSLIRSIGEAIITSSSYFEENISDNTIDYCTKELKGCFPSFLNKAQLLSSIKLVKCYKTNIDFSNIFDMVSWPYIKVLLTINDKGKHIVIINHLLTRKTNLSTFKKNISKEFFDKEIEVYIPSKADNYKLVAITSERNKQNTLIGYHYERKYKNDEFQKLVNTNIFKNKEFLNFMCKV
ncbi:DUF1016 N-terminal domain-containing protein [Sphingobacterium lactis]|uniref:DUF1016 N-terminal domain-containing protein n=1 Tax=Sphingobacterium lactis TaxID=797291 RepID=UPI003DA31D03